MHADALPRRPPLRRLLSCLPVLVALWMVDGWLSRDGYAGWERNSVRNSERRWDPRKSAKVAILGSSTSKDWLPGQLIEKVLKLPGRSVVDAHINGCHQGCTYAEVRRMIQRGHRYDTVFFGTNLFQLCEFAHSKRVLQQQMMTPTTDVPRLFGLYLHAEQPLQYIGRFLGMRLSGAYGDTAAVRADLSRRVLGEGKRGQGHRWHRPRVARADEPLTCAYDDDSVALKRAFTEAMLDDLAGMADHVYLMLLPDRTLALDDPAIRASWAKHVALHRALAEARPHVTLVDLVTDGVDDPRKYRDGFHLNGRGIADQRALFERRMKAILAAGGGR